MFSKTISAGNRRDDMMLTLFQSDLRFPNTTIHNTAYTGVDWLVTMIVWDLFQWNFSGMLQYYDVQYNALPLHEYDPEICDSHYA